MPDSHRTSLFTPRPEPRSTFAEVFCCLRTLSLSQARREILAAASPFWPPAPPPATYLPWCGLWVATMLALAIRWFESPEV